jgi:hypothetical protein
VDLDDAYTQSCEVKRIFQYCNAQLITVDLFMTIESEKELGLFSKCYDVALYTSL